jgi:hypothetical protein
MTDPALEARLIELVGQGHKIEAIKTLRQATGIGLKDAKDAVDQLQRSGTLGPLPPAIPPGPRSGSNAGLWMFLIVLAAVAWWILRSRV